MKQEGYEVTVTVFGMQIKKISKEKLMELTPKETAAIISNTEILAIFFKFIIFFSTI